MAFAGFVVENTVKFTREVEGFSYFYGNFEGFLTRIQESYELNDVIHECVI